MAQVQPLLCCGWAELHGVQNYKPEDFHNLLRLATQYRRGAYVFSSALTKGFENADTCGATQFAAAIKRNKLGIISKIRSFRNPNSSRTIVPYLWIVAPVNLQKYCEKHRIA